MQQENALPRLQEPDTIPVAEPDEFIPQPHTILLQDPYYYYRLATGWTVRRSNPGGGEIFRSRPDRPWGPPSLLYNGCRVFLPGVKRPGRGIDHPPSSSFLFFFLPMARRPYMGLGLLVSSRFHDHTHLRHTTVGRTPLDQGPARRRDLYLTTHNTHKRQTSMPPVGFFLFCLYGVFPLLIHFCTV
jgi:hypothetical protein